ncbi:type II secretion system protein [Oceanicola sp. 22II-s10i]|uniref:type II secretion system protein n=1 Tax=Oceanicola sp. 22II-s10i TaxID=1317116 RepID=UPI000B528E1A|nr:type II secretion system protein [Oceanicola sp. 22II-s10i]
MPLGRMSRRRGADRGLTLLELAVAILILSIGSLAALRATGQSQRAIGGGMPRLMAEVVARNRVEELRIPAPPGAAPALPATVEMGGRSFAVTTRTEATEGGFVRVTVTARSEGGAGPGALLVTYLPVRR